MNEIHLLRPYSLFLFLPFIIFAFLLARRSSSTSIWQKICSPDLMPYVLTQHAKRNTTSWVLAAITLFLLISALAGPAWQFISVPLIKSQSGLVIVLDLSTSMNANDIKPSRLQRAIYKVNDLLNQRREGQTALLVFSDETFVVTPLTDDIATIKSLLPALDTSIMPSSGQEVNKAIIKASELLTQAGISDGSILLITSTLSQQDMKKTIDSAIQKRVKISVLGVGGEEATPIRKVDGSFVKDSKGALLITTLAKERLTQLATATHGIYQTISVDDSDINELAQNFIDSSLSTAKEKTELTQQKWHDQGYYLVLLALPFAAFLFRRGLLVMILFLIPHGLQAYTWNHLWKTSDQQAEELFHQEKYQEAKELFQNREWQAATNYKLGDYETASELLQDPQTAEGFFNYGTARAKLGDFEGALAAYDKALEMQPSHEDALYNKQLIEDYQKQQQKEQQDNKNKNDNKNDKKDDQDNKNEQEKNQKNSDQNKQKNDQQKNAQQKKDQNQDENHQQDPDQKNDQQQEEKQDDDDLKNDSKEDQSDDQKSDNSSQDPSNEAESEKPSDERQKEFNQDYRNRLDKELEKQEKKSPQQKVAQEELSPDDQQRQIDDRWLQKIKDDPGGLLRRKFLQQYRQQKK